MTLLPQESTIETRVAETSHHFILPLTTNIPSTKEKSQLRLHKQVRCSRLVAMIHAHCLNSLPRILNALLLQYLKTLGANARMNLRTSSFKVWDQEGECFVNSVAPLNHVILVKSAGSVFTV